MKSCSWRRAPPGTAPEPQDSTDGEGGGGGSSKGRHRTALRILDENPELLKSIRRPNTSRGSPGFGSIGPTWRGPC